MKKACCILLTILYVGLSAGVPFYCHYCTGKLKAVSVFRDSAECPRCGKKESACKKCRTEVKIVQLTADQNIMSRNAGHFSQKYVADIFWQFNGNTQPLSSYSSYDIPSSQFVGPPGVPLWLRAQVLRI